MSVYAPSLALQPDNAKRPRLLSMVQFNYKDGEIVSSPTVIVSGSCNSEYGVVEFINNENKVFPPQHYEVNNGRFKAIVHVTPEGANCFAVNVWDKACLNAGGFLANGKVISEKGQLTLFFNPLPENKPLHMCVVVGLDSIGSYDMPKYKIQQGQVADLNSAIQRLKVAGRMMQAFTQDEFRSVGMSNRSFQLTEETVHQQGIFGYSGNCKVPHSEVKIHVLRSPKTVKQLRDPNYAQQNRDATDNGWLFGHALDLIKKEDFYQPYKEMGTAVQCAVMYLDSHWDSKMILTHAALGGGTGEIKLAIFGSHGLHSFPLSFPQISPSFTDDTKLSTSEVANDANQCSTSWECLNICMGAFMHEIGHSFGSPHQTDGVMLRDYIWWNRSFMTREGYCIRENRKGEMVDKSGVWKRTCHWNIRDLMRYLYHDSFSLPIDKDDATFLKIQQTTLRPNEIYKHKEKPLSFILSPGVVSVKSYAGIYMVELCGQDLARFHMPFFPRSYGGTGLQNEILLDYQELHHNFKQSWKDAGDEFDVRVLSVAGDLYINNFKKSSVLTQDDVIRSDFGLQRGAILGYKGELLGSAKGGMQYIGFDISKISKIRIYHGGALDGVTFFFKSGNTDPAPPVPKRDYVMSILRRPLPPKNSLKDDSWSHEVTLGNKKPHFTDFDISPGELVTRLIFRSGQWIDAMCVETNTERSSGLLGNANGGHQSVLEAPTSRRMVGMYGYCGRWMDGLGIIYADI